MDTSTSTDVTAISAGLVRWVGEEFWGRVGTGTDRQRPRLTVGDSAAHLGWDVRPDHLAVWVRTLRESDQQLLREKLSAPASVRRRTNDWVFDVFSESDAAVFREIIRWHVIAGGR